MLASLIAGVALATFPYSVEFNGKIKNIRDFFITLFFVSLGMQIPVPTAEAILMGVLIAAVVLIFRWLGIYSVVRMLRGPADLATLAKLMAPPTRASQGLQDAMQAAKLGKERSSSGPVPDKLVTVSEGPPPRVELSGRKVVVVGHGPVGHDFVVKLVGMVGDGALDITVLGEEPRLAYDRVHLTEYFEHREAIKLSMVDPKWAEEHKVTIRTNARVESLDRHNQRLSVKDTTIGKIEELSYDACVLSTEIGRAHV